MGCSKSKMEIGVSGFRSAWDHGWVGFKSAWVASARRGPCVVVGLIWRELGLSHLESSGVVRQRRRRRAWLMTARRRNCGGLGGELRRALWSSFFAPIRISIWSSRVLDPIPDLTSQFFYALFASTLLFLDLKFFLAYKSSFKDLISKWMLRERNAKLEHWNLVFKTQFISLKSSFLDLRY